MVNGFSDLGAKDAYQSKQWGVVQSYLLSELLFVHILLKHLYLLLCIMSTDLSVSTGEVA